MAVTFAGCAGGGTSSGSTSTSSGSSSESSTVSEESAQGTLDTSKEVELIMYFISDRPAKYDEIEANFNALFKEKLNCTLKTQWIGWAEYSNKYPLLFSSGEKFDIAYTATWLKYASLAQKGAFMPLDDLWPTYAPNNWAMQSDTAKEQAKVNGSYYCIPTLLATYSAFGPIYRTDILEGTDWDGKMETIEDLEVYLDYVKEAAPEMEPLNVYSTGGVMDGLWQGQNEHYTMRGTDYLWVDPYAEKPEVKIIYEDETIMDYLTMMKRWCDKGFYSKSALADTDSTKVRNGKAASSIHNIDSYAGSYIENPEWGFKYANYIKDVSNLAFTQDACVIPTTSQNPERALALYDYITTDEEAFRTFYYGIEGTSYEIIDEQVKSINTDDYAFSAMWAARTSGINLDSYGAPDDLNVIKAGFDEYIERVGNKQSQLLGGFTVNTESIETEYAACVNVIQQYWWPLSLGYSDDMEAGLAEFISKMEAAGVEKVRAEFQKQLDEFMAGQA